MQSQALLAIHHCPPTLDLKGWKIGHLAPIAKPGPFSQLFDVWISDYLKMYIPESLHDFFSPEMKLSKPISPDIAKLHILLKIYLI